MFVAVPSFVGLACIGQPIVKLLFSRYNSVQGGMMLKIGAIAVVFYTLSTVTSSALQGIDKMKLPMIHSFISLTVHVIIVYILLRVTNLGIYAVVIGNATFPVLIFILNFISLYKYANYRFPAVEVFIKPVISSAIMGVCTFLAYKLVYMLVSSNAVALICAFSVAGATYFIPYWFLSKKNI